MVFAFNPWWKPLQSQSNFRFCICRGTEGGTKVGLGSHAFTHTHTHIHVCMHACIHTYIYIHCIYACMSWSIWINSIRCQDMLQHPPNCSKLVKSSMPIRKAKFRLWGHEGELTLVFGPCWVLYLRHLECGIGRARKAEHVLD